jgi:hypothetical protein
VFSDLGLRPLAVLVAQEIERLRQGSRRLTN